MSKIIPGALVDGGFTQAVPLRIWSCRVLGAAASRLESSKYVVFTFFTYIYIYIFKKKIFMAPISFKRVEFFFKKAVLLCQDTDYEVRACMCDQLNAFVKAVKYV